MGEKLIIKNFGPIKSVELNLGRFNVLIGEQATGKTMVAKLLAMCRYFSYIANTYRDTNRADDFRDALIEWGLEESITDTTEINYDCVDYNVIFKNDIRISVGNYENIVHSGFSRSLEPKTTAFRNLIGELHTFDVSPSSLLQSRVPPTSFFRDSVSSVMNYPFFLPTERGLQSIFSLGKSSIQNINDALFNQFARIDQIQRFFSSETEIEPLGIFYRNVNGKGFFRMKNEDKWYSMANAPSGFQTGVPVILVLKYYSEKREKKKTIIIDEPEISLFPASQEKLVRFLSSYIFQSKRIHLNKEQNGVIEEPLENSVFLTTHSPYILTSLNNLIYACYSGKGNERITEIIDKKYWVNPEEVSVYMMLPDGTCEDIFDREETLISSEKIDGVSRIINEQFDKMLNIEFGITKEHV